MVNKIKFEIYFCLDSPRELGILKLQDRLNWESFDAMQNSLTPAKVLLNF